MEIKGKTAVITGATGRLGFEVTLALAEGGCNCVCHYHRNKQRADELVEKVSEFNVEAIAVKGDLTEEAGAAGLFELSEAWSVPQILINSAAVFSRQPLSEVNFERARSLLDLNLTAAIMTSRFFAEKIQQKSTGSDSVTGKIINITGLGAVRPWAEYVLYCASKAGLAGTTKSLAKELAPNICVNAIAPGLVTWPENFSEEQKKRQLAMIPMKRVAQPAEIAEAIIFLLENDYITGQTLCIDGGRSI